MGFGAHLQEAHVDGAWPLGGHLQEADICYSAFASGKESVHLRTANQASQSLIHFAHYFRYVFWTPAC
jgi:hypothetical protein